MSKEFTCVGLMSGTSADGVDASVINSDGNDKYNVIKNKFFKYPFEIYNLIHNLKDKIKYLKDLNSHSSDINLVEKKITLFHAKAIQEISKNLNVDLIGFHGQTIYHNSSEKISKQLGDGKLLCQLTKKNIVNNFRHNDITHGGEGAPLTPIFHKVLIKKNNIKTPCCILNIGGITNVTIFSGGRKDSFFSRDIGPGNCLIDEWVRKNSDKQIDFDGILANSGKKNEIILEQVQDFMEDKLLKKRSLDISDFDISFARGLSLEDGAATLTYLTSSIVASSILATLEKQKKWNILLSGGGRKNPVLVNTIKKITLNKFKFENIDKYGIDGDFVESQAFAYLAIRSFLKLPITFPSTTGCSRPITGGDLIKF